MNDELLASLGSLSCHCWSLAAHVSQASQSAWKGLTAGSSSSDQEQWAARPKGPLLWFHALTLGETAVVLPVVFRCLLEYNEHVHVLLTTKSAEAISLLSSSLPPRVIVQDVPLDSYVSMGRFLAHFQPQACILMESPAWPVLVESCASRGIKMGLLNARMSSRAFLAWFQRRMSRALLQRMLTSFSLIVPQSDIDVGRFRIFGATLMQMPGWCSDLKYAAALGNSVWHLWRPKPSRIASLRSALCGRPLWVAAHTQPGEEEAVAGVHSQVAKDWPSLLTVLAPAASGRCGEVAEMLGSLYSLRVLVWSSVVDVIAPQAHKQQQQQQQPPPPSQSSSWLQAWRGGSRGADGHQQQQQAQEAAAAAAAAGSSGSTGTPGAVDPAMLLKGVDVLLLDLQADLPLMYSVSEVAFIGSSLLEGCSGHNLAEAAVAGCAVLVGEHAGHFSTMADELNQAAIVAAEEASAAVNSSGPMEDPFFAAGGDSAASTVAQTMAAPAAGAGAGTSGAGAAAAAAAGGSSTAHHATLVEGAESEEPSPRDGSHWRGVLSYTQHEDEHGQYADSSAGGSRDGYGSNQQLQQQQHQQLQQLLQQQGLRPSSAPAAVSSAGGAPGSSSSPGTAPLPAGTRAAAPTPESSSLGGSGVGPHGARNTAALLYRRHARTGSSANSSCVGSPVASQRPSTAGGSAYSQQQQHGQQPQHQQQQPRQEGGSYLQQHQQQQSQQQQSQQRVLGPSPLQQSSAEQVQHQQQGCHNPQQQQQQGAAGTQGAAQQHDSHSNNSSGGGGSDYCPAHQRCPAVDRPVPQAPPPSAASNTPANGPTGNVTPVTPAGSFGGADPALLQQPDSRVLAQRLAQQQQQQRVSGPAQVSNLDPGAAQQQPGADSKQRQQNATAAGSSGGGTAGPQDLQLQLRGNSSSGGGASNAASTPLSGVTDLYSMPFPTSPRRERPVPQTPNTTPADSAHAMGGRSPMLSSGGIAYAPDLASLALQTAPVEVLHDAPSAEPSWQSACSSSSTSGGCAGSSGGCAGSNGSNDSGCTDSSGGAAGQQDAAAVGHGESAREQQQRWRSQDGASLLQRPACPSPPEDPCFSRASASSTVSSLPVFSNSSSSAANGSSGSRSRLGRAISSGGWQEEQQRLRHQQQLQGVANGVWRGGSEGGSPMVAALADAAAAGDESSSSDDGDDDGQRERMCNGRASSRPPHRRPVSPPLQAAAAAPAAAGEAAGESVPQGHVCNFSSQAADSEDGGAAATRGVSLNGHTLSAESSGLFDGADGEHTDGSEVGGSNDGSNAGSSRMESLLEGSEDLLPFSRSPTFAELAACHVLSSSTDGNSAAGGQAHNAAAAGGGGGGKGVSLQLAAGGVVVSASISGGAVSAKEEGGQPGCNGCSRSSSQEVTVLDLSEQLQQQQSRLASDQGSVGWEDWGHEQHQQHQQQQHQQCNGVSQHSGVQGTADGVSGSSSGCSSGSGEGVPGSGSSTAAASSNTAPASSAAAAMRSSESGAGGTSRLGDPRRSRHFLDLHSDSPRSSVGEDMGDIHHHQQHQQQQPLPSQQVLQSLHQPQLLSYSGTGSASTAAAGVQSGPGMGAEGVSGGSSSMGGMHSSSSGGGGGLWLEPHGGGATPPSWGATPRSTPQQHAYSASTTPSAGVTPRAAPSRPPGGRGGSHSSNSYYHGYGSNAHGHHAHPHGYQQQGSGRLSADLAQQHHGGYAQLHHQHVQQHLMEGSSGGGSGMLSPLSRLADSSYRRAESVTSMTSFAASIGGDLMHDDQPGSSRMSLMGENSSHMGFSTTGGRFSGFTGDAFASTGRFSECATPRSTVTDVFRGQSEPQVAVVGGDAGLLNQGTSYLRYRGEYILPATHLPAAPQGPAVWRVSGESGLSVALNNLLQEPLERRSRGHAAAQAAAKLASGLVSTVWHVVDDMVVTPALQDFVAQGGLNGGDAAVQHAARAARIPGHPRI